MSLWQLFLGDLFLFKDMVMVIVMVVVVRVVVVSVLRRHGDSNASVAEQGLWAIKNLADDAGNRTKLGACDGCAGVRWWCLIVCDLAVLYVQFVKLLWYLSLFVRACVCPM